MGVPMAKRLYTRMTELYLIDDIMLTVVFGSGGTGKLSELSSKWQQCDS